MSYQLGDLLLLSLSHPLFWLYFIIFWFSVFIAFFIPGRVILGKIQVPTLSVIVLSLATGLVMWALQGYVFGILGIRRATFIYLIIFFLIWVIRSKNIQTVRYKTQFTNLASILIIILGTLFHQLPVWYTALLTKDGLSFCCYIPMNTIGHLARTNQVIHRIPPFQSGVYGLEIHNYHYWFNIVVGELSRVFHLPLLPTQSQYFPLFLSLLFGGSALVLAQALQFSKRTTHWFLFFLYFSVGLDFLLRFFLKQPQPRIPQMDSAMTFLDNPPTAISTLILLVIICLAHLWLKNPTIKSSLPFVLSVGTLVGFKVYAGIFAIVGFLPVAIWMAIKKYEWRPVAILVIAVSISFLIYLPVNKGAGGIYFSGFWRVEESAKDIHIFGNQTLEKLTSMSKGKRFLSLQPKELLKVLSLEVFLVFVYLISFFGTKLIALWKLKTSLIMIPFWLNIFLLPASLISLTIGLFFQQQSGGGHTHNFLTLVSFVLSFYAACAVSGLIAKKRTYYISILVVGFIALHIYRFGLQIRYIITEYMSDHIYTISWDEIAAAQFIRTSTNPDARFLVDPKNPVDSIEAYVSFLIDRPMVLSGLHTLGTHNIDVSDKVKGVQTIFRSSDINVTRQTLEELHVDYLYLLPSTKLAIGESAIEAKEVFRNASVRILQLPRRAAITAML